MNRESGYYWVLIMDSWVIGNYDKTGNTWFLMGNIKGYKDSDFDFIEETKIVHDL